VPSARLQVEDLDASRMREDVMIAADALREAEAAQRGSQRLEVDCVV
jgi:hypothetical protein